MKKTSAKSNKRTLKRTDPKDCDISHIGPRIKSIRNSLHISVKDWVTELNLPEHKIRRLESGDGSSLETFVQVVNHLCAKYKINPTWIILHDNKHISKLIKSYKEISEEVAALTQLSVDQTIVK